VLGKINNAVVNQGKSVVAKLVNEGKLSTVDADYIFNRIGG
jgi:dephospho-CoA kinase